MRAIDESEQSEIELEGEGGGGRRGRADLTRESGKTHTHKYITIIHFH